MSPFNEFRAIWCVDFEYRADPGERFDVQCVVARELRSGQIIRRCRDELGAAPPFSIGEDTLFVCFYAPAELGSFLSLGWPMPANILDLFVEFRHLTNGRPPPLGNGLLSALIYHGLDHIDAVEKREMRDLAMRGGPFSANERVGLLDYCESDVTALVNLLPAMAHKFRSRVDLGRALLRGAYMIPVAMMEHAGVPIDVEALELLREKLPTIQDQLLADIDADYDVYDGPHFNYEKFERFLARAGIPWPTLESGQLDVKDKTFRQMAKCFPIISPLRELRYMRKQLQLAKLLVGADGRNRAMLSPYGTKTGRNKPSSGGYIFGPAVWLRGLVKPEQGRAIAYIDWSQQEFGIAAALSGDQRMLAAYMSGDPYLAFAKQAGLVPLDATKKSHGPQRELCKQCVLGVQYGMEKYTLARRINQPPMVAEDLLRAHRETYRVFWKWSNGALDFATTRNFLPTVYDWRVHIGPDFNPRSLRNFPMQANGAEMMRLACCYGIKEGVEIVAPVHDALLIAAPLERLDADVATMQAAMAKASRTVLGGLELRSDAKIIRYPDRYMDEDRGAVMWNKVWSLIGREEMRWEEAA